MPSAMEEASSTRLLVDEVILDYLLWYCTSALLSDRKHRTDESFRKAEIGIKLAHNLFQTFQRLYPNSQLPEPIALRLRICCFTAMLLRRIDITSSDFMSNVSARLRRTQSWLRRRNISSVLPSTADRGVFLVPFEAAQLERNSSLVLESLGYRAGSLYGNATLRDVLWEFLVLTAHISARVDEVNELWMTNTIDLMIHATMEAYRCNGCKGVGPVDEAFAVGLTDMSGFDIEDASAEELVVNELFAGNGGEVGNEFETLKQDGLTEVIPPGGTSMQTHFDSLEAETPWPQLEGRILNYIIGNTKNQARPVLAQLEQGRLDGFDARDVQAALARAGVSAEVWS